jgi:hypothetical protein
MSTNTFSNYVQKQNGQNVDATWWNQLALAGINLESWFGLSGFSGETTFTIANNQSSPANVTGALFNGATQRSFELDYQVYINTTGSGATELSERGKIFGAYSTVAGTWEITVSGAVGSSGVTFSMTNAGQLQYTSQNTTGTAASSSLHYTYRTMGV